MTVNTNRIWPFNNWIWSLRRWFRPILKSRIRLRSCPGKSCLSYTEKALRKTRGNWGWTGPPRKRARPTHRSLIFRANKSSIKPSYNKKTSINTTINTRKAVMNLIRHIRISLTSSRTKTGQNWLKNTNPNLRSHTCSFTAPSIKRGSRDKPN